MASWSVKATPEETPVKLSPCRVMLMAESSEDKSSFISPGSCGSGLASYLEQSSLAFPLHPAPVGSDKQSVIMVASVAVAGL